MDATLRDDPEHALRRLVEGNQRFVKHQLTSWNAELAARITSTSDQQAPFAAVLACADSRVPVEMVFDQCIGDIFVTRLAGNIVTPEIMGSLEYATAVLRTQVLMVLGHSHCGAVRAAVEAKDVPGQISSLFPHIRPAVNLAGSNAEEVSKLNAKMQADLLRNESSVIGAAVRQGNLRVVSAYYTVQDGRVTLLS